MEVILLKEAQNLGAAGQTVTVKDGYARNFLIPRGLAVVATASHRAQVESLQAVRARKAQGLREKALQLSRRLSQRPLTLAVTVGDQGKLHGAVTAGDIVQELERQGISLERHQVTLENPLTQLGSHDLSIKLHPEVTATLRVVVVKR